MEEGTDYRSTIIRHKDIKNPIKETSLRHDKQREEAKKDLGLMPKEFESQKLPYEDLVSFIYRSLERHGKTPIDLTYDLLNEMAKELYEASPNVDREEARDFRLDFNDRDVLGRQLRDLRCRYGVGLRELARFAEYHPSYIEDVEILGKRRQRFTPALKSLSRYLIGLKKAVESKASSYR
ncbi:MAG: helix-turn-helix transcriptional regulator [Candidatus Aenigmatarchaeota archaeon]